MKRQHYLDLNYRPMDWQDRIVIKACIFVAMAFAWFVFVNFI